MFFWGQIYSRTPALLPRKFSWNQDPQVLVDKKIYMGWWQNGPPPTVNIFMFLIRHQLVNQIPPIAAIPINRSMHVFKFIPLISWFDHSVPRSCWRVNPQKYQLGWSENDLQNRGTLLHLLVKYHCPRELFFHLGGILYPYFQSDPHIVLSWFSIASPSYLPEGSWIYCLNHHKLVVKNSRNRLYILHPHEFLIKSYYKTLIHIQHYIKSMNNHHKPHKFPFKSY